MRAFAMAMLATAASLAVVSPARASADNTCYPTWKLASKSYDCADRIVLAPGNDSRVNLFLLLRSRDPVAEGGLAYPAHESEEREFGHTFLSWPDVRASWFPVPKSGDSTDSVAAPRDGSRCDSFASGSQAFADALAAEHGLPAGERAALAGLRANIHHDCKPATAATPFAWPGTIASGAGRDFLGYLKGVDAFYRCDWAGARAAFSALTSARQRWVAETAAYMVIRVELGAAIDGDFDNYGDFAGVDKADHAAAARARTAIAAYLRGWPQGRYAGSAKGLERRALWLTGDQAGLAHAYQALLDKAGASAPGVVDLIEEIDHKLLTQAGAGKAVDTPILLAVLDLMRMRTDQTDHPAGNSAVFAADELAAQRPVFATYPATFAYLSAARAFYIDHDAKGALTLLPATPQTGYRPLDFSGQVLRGMALADLNDPGEAAFWRGLLGGATALYQRPLVELALARQFERSRQIAAALTAGSPLTEFEPRAILLEHDAGPALLRALARGGGRDAREQAIAAFTLQWKELSRGQYADFLNDLHLLRADSPIKGSPSDYLGGDDVPLGLFVAGKWSDGYACPSLAETATTLARAPTNAKATLCLGDFYRLNGLDGFSALDTPHPADELGSGPTDFAGTPQPRAIFYARIIAEPRAAPAERAYALFRAVHCYAPSGINDCGGKDVPKPQRRAWFEQLKHDYAQSNWARSLQYYW